MTLMTMDDKLILRHGLIDRNHQELFDVIDLLALALKSGNGKRSCIKIASELLDLARRHFAMEEALMTQHRYPQATSHGDEHARFIAGILDFMNKLEAGHGIFFSAQPNLLRDWLSAHITRSDRALVAELRNQHY